MSDLPKYQGPLFKLVLGKFPILQIEDRAFGIKRFSIQIGDRTLIIDAPHDADLREGDLITLYTEVPFARPQ